MKKTILSLVAFLAALSTFAQTDSTQVATDSALVNPKAIPHTQSMHSVGVNVGTFMVGEILLTYTYTQRLGKRSTLSGGIGLQHGDMNLGIYPTYSGNVSWVDLDYRYNYSILKRARKNKTTYCNSSNYFGVFVNNETTLRSDFPTFSKTLIMAQWGFQRSLFQSNLFVNGAIRWGFSRTYNLKSYYFGKDSQLEFGLGYKF